MIETRKERKRKGSEGGLSRKNRRRSFLSSYPYLLALPVILLVLGVIAGMLSARGDMP